MVKVYKATYAVGNLLPASTTSPFPFIAEAVLVDVNDALPALLSQSSHGIGSIPEFLQCAGSVPVHDDVHVCEELLELLAAGLCLQV